MISAVLTLHLQMSSMGTSAWSFTRTADWQDLARTWPAHRGGELGPFRGSQEPSFGDFGGQNRRCPRASRVDFLRASRVGPQFQHGLNCYITSSGTGDHRLYSLHLLKTMSLYTMYLLCPTIWYSLQLVNFSLVLCTAWKVSLFNSANWLLQITLKDTSQIQSDNQTSLSVLLDVGKQDSSITYKWKSLHC